MKVGRVNLGRVLQAGVGAKEQVLDLSVGFVPFIT